MARLFDFVIQCCWSDPAMGYAALTDAVRSSGGQIACYRTIDEANAVNQREPEVLRAIYGASAI